MNMNASEFQQRRERVLKYLQKQGAALAIFAAAPMATRSNDTEYDYRQNSDFYYLTGFNEPNAFLVLAPSTEHPVTLFCQASDPVAEVWHGRRFGIDRAQKELGVDLALDSDDFIDVVPDLLDGHDKVYSLHSDTDLLALITETANDLRQRAKRGHHAPVSFHDASGLLAQMRLIKSAAELELMRQAAKISVDAHKRAMRFTRPGVWEYQIAAELHHEFMTQGAMSPAYGTIVGSGENACILHYTENGSQARDGDLVLIDAGAEYQGYAADITRTFPVNGRFSEHQKALYNVVLAAQNAALETIKPGKTFNQAMQAAGKVLTQGLLDLGILEGDFETCWREELYRPFMIHGLGHWLGLDVHDVGAYKVDGKDTKFVENMVLTVEPGIYIPPLRAEIDPKWHGIGIRIEDDVIVTADGHENMTAGVPKSVTEIEKWMQKP